MQVIAHAARLADDGAQAAARAAGDREEQLVVVASGHGTRRLDPDLRP